VVTGYADDLDVGRDVGREVARSAERVALALDHQDRHTGRRQLRRAGSLRPGRRAQRKRQREHGVGTRGERGAAGHPGAAAAAAEHQPTGGDREPQAHDDGGEGLVELSGRDRRPLAGDPVRLLDPGDRPAGRDERGRDREQVRRLDPAAGTVPEDRQPDRIEVLDRLLQVGPGGADRRLDVEPAGQCAASYFA
jgi:hypothetical protein